MAHPHNALVVDVGELVQDGDHIHAAGQAEAEAGARRIAVAGQVGDLRWTRSTPSMEPGSARLWV